MKHSKRGSGADRSSWDSDGGDPDAEYFRQLRDAPDGARGHRDAIEYDDVPGTSDHDDVPGRAPFAPVGAPFDAAGAPPVPAGAPPVPAGPAATVTGIQGAEPVAPVMTVEAPAGPVGPVVEPPLLAGAAAHGGMAGYSGEIASNDVAGEWVSCPQCGEGATIDPTHRRAEDFCRKCDFPLFWARSAVMTVESNRTGASLRRLPGTVGRAATASVACPHCGEPNSPIAEYCVRCSQPMVIVELAPEPEPEVAYVPPPPEPEPEPEPEPSATWVIVVCMVIIVIIVVWALLLQ